MANNLMTWQEILIKWVNCLNFQDTAIQTFSELGDAKIFNGLLNVIYYKKQHGSIINEADKAVTKFLKCEYPLYVMESKFCEMDDLEIMNVTSLLMLHCILKSQDKNIMERMYKLDDETQVYIKNFFEIIMQYDNITRNIVQHAVSQCAPGNDKSPKETIKGHSTESPLISFRTPKCSSIMDVVQSPLARKLKELSEQRKVIEGLNNELDTEKEERFKLQEELQQERNKTKKLTRQLMDLKADMKKVQEELICRDCESHKKANYSQETFLKKEIKDLEMCISSLHNEIEMLHNKQDLLQQRALKAENQYQLLYAELQRNEALCEKLKHDAVQKECELAHAKELCSELQRHLQEMKQVHNMSIEEDPSFTSPGCRTPENLCQAVTDLRLQEQLEQNEIITEQLNKLIMEEEVMKKQICDLQINSEVTEREADTLKAANLELQGKYETLLEINLKLQSEIDDMKGEMEKERKAIRYEYEKKLDLLKAKMRALCEEQVKKMTKKSQNEIEHLRAMCRFYKDKVDFLEKQGALSNLEKRRSIAGSSREVHRLNVTEKSITFVGQKKSAPSSLQPGMGAMCNPKDEKLEVFKTTNLADLIAGRCTPEDYTGRMSELQYRNSLCPPHLKSCYPAETQFHDPREYRDEDLKFGCAVSVDQCDSLSTSMLPPSEKQRKKDRRQGTEVPTPCAPLEESNDRASLPKVSTASHLKSLFMTKNHQDENIPVTPRG